MEERIKFNKKDYFKINFEFNKNYLKINLKLITNEINIKSKLFLKINLKFNTY